MKKLVIVLLGVFFTTTLIARELVNNNNIAQPTQSKNVYGSLVIKRFVLADNSEASYYNIINSVLRNVGSDNKKNINIIWTNKTGAERIQQALTAKGVSKNRINLIHNPKKRPLYPVYVEVESISAKRAKCDVDTAEDMMSFNTYVPCATESNNRIQLKN